MALVLIFMGYRRSKKRGARGCQVIRALFLRVDRGIPSISKALRRICNRLLFMRRLLETLFPWVVF